MPSFDQFWIEEAPSDEEVLRAAGIDPIPVADRAVALFVSTPLDWRNALITALIEALIREGVRQIVGVRDSEQLCKEYETRYLTPADPLGRIHAYSANMDRQPCGKGKKGHRKLIGKLGGGWR